MKRVIVKLSGEALAGAKSQCIDAKSVEVIAKELVNITKLGYQVGVVTGAGNIWRGRDAVSFGMDKADADQMGILATILNSLALQNEIIKLGGKTQVLTSIPVPTIAQLFNRHEAIKLMEEGVIVIFGGGTGLPFFTTDSCAALRAAEVKADAILMAKNGVDGVYDDDPKVNHAAHRYEKLTYQEILAKNLHVMDATAAALCQDNQIKIIVFDMNKPGNITKVLENPAIGTIIEN